MIARIIKGISREHIQLIYVAKINGGLRVSSENLNEFDAPYENDHILCLLRFCKKKYGSAHCEPIDYSEIKHLIGGGKVCIIHSKPFEGML